MKHTILIALSALLAALALSCRKQTETEIIQGNLSGKWALMEEGSEELACGHYLDFYIGRCYQYSFTGEHPVARDSMWDCRNILTVLTREMDYRLTDNSIAFDGQAPEPFTKIGDDRMQIGGKRYCRVKHFINKQRSDYTVESVGMSAPSITLLNGGEADLHFQVSPAKAIYHKVEWTSSNPKIISVDREGHVKALSAGQARISVTLDEQVSGECTVSAGNNLSEPETANCYIISAPGRWFFRADVKGNGTQKTVPNGYTGTLKASVLWESDGTPNAPQAGSIVKNVEWVDQHIFFTTGENNGNALVALTNESGQIYWSWHLWVCQNFDPEASRQQYKNSVPSTAEDKKDVFLMDRNLGALSGMPENITFTGLLYQWGRKDPFPGIAAIQKNDNTPVATTGGPLQVVDGSETVGTIEYATAHPTHFIKPVKNYAYGAFNWFYSTDSNRQTERINSMWASSKTLYDPCPPGWRVPSGFVGLANEQYGVWRSSLPWSSANGKYWTGLVSFNLTEVLSKKSGDTCCYPVGGKIEGLTGTYKGVGGMGYYWSCTNCKDKGMDYFYPSGFYLVHDDRGSCACYANAPNWIGVMDDNFFTRANGQSVRCQKIVTE